MGFLDNIISSVPLPCTAKPLASQDVPNKQVRIWQKCSGGVLNQNVSSCQHLVTAGTYTAASNPELFPVYGVSIGLGASVELLDANGKSIGLSKCYNHPDAVKIAKVIVTSTENFEGFGNLSGSSFGLLDVVLIALILLAIFLIYRQ